MTIARLCWLLALLAFAANNPPRTFQHDAHVRGDWEVNRHFVGIDWRCRRPYQDEICFAGLNLDTLTLETGP